MYQKRTQIIRSIPLARKGTKYVVRAADHIREGVPVSIAIRDMLKLARTSKEVKKIVNSKSLKLNGKEIKDIKECIKMFNILEADKKYVLKVLTSGRFYFEETKDNHRLAKIINKKVLPGGKMQLNLHDGSNLISKEKVNVGDSLRLTIDGKMEKIITLEKGKEIFVISGRSIGKIGKIKSVEGNHVRVEFEDKEVVLDKSHLIVK